jgi:hypothetical protein
MAAPATAESTLREFARRLGELEVASFRVPSMSGADPVSVSPGSFWTRTDTDRVFLALGSNVVEVTTSAKQHVVRASVAAGSYPFVTFTWGPTLPSVPSVVSTLDLGGLPVSSSIGFVSTTSYRQYSSAWANGGLPAVLVHFIATVYL